MKQIKKILVFILSVALAVGAFITSPIRKIKAETIPTGNQRLGATISLTKLPTTGTVGNTFTLPKGQTNDGEVVMVVKDSRGNVIYNNTDSANVVKADNVTDNGTEIVVAPNRVGTYTVQYKTINATNYSNATSQVYAIEVKGVKPVFSFDTNTRFMIPSEIAGTDSVTLPFPTVTNSEDEEIVTDIEDSNLTITAMSPKHTAVTLTSKVIGDKEYRVFAPLKDSDDKIVYGTYTITYNYTDTNGLIVTKSYSVKVSENLDYAQQDLTMTFEKSVPTSLVLGNETTLPTPTVLDKNNGNAKVDSFAEVEVRYFAAGDTTGEVIATDNLTFTPMKKATAGAYYLVKYTVNTFNSLNNENVKPLTAEYIIKNVQDTEAPKLFVVDAYETDADMSNIASVDYRIPTKIVVNETYVLPAIYAEDNYKTTDNTITLTRSITDPDANEQILKYELTDSEKDSTSPKYTEVANNENYTYRFEKVGTYYVKYTATDSAKNKTELSYKVVVVDGNVDTFDTTAPVISMSTIPGNAKAGEKVTFKAPTATDYVTGTKDVVDDRVELNVFYATEYTISSDGIIVSDENKIKVELNEDGLYEFTAPTTSASTLAVIVEATDDHGNKSVEYRTVDLINVIADSTAPELKTTLPTDSTSEKQGERVVVPTLVFEDVNYKFVNVNVWVYDQKGNDVEVLGKSLEYKDATNTVEVKNINFLANNKGVYTVVVTASDASGNTTIVSYTHYVPDTEAPTIELDEIPTTAEVGVAIDLPKPIIKDDNEVTNYEATIVFVGDSNPSNYTLNGYKFTPGAVGTYTFKYVTTDGTNIAESAVYSITVKDTIKPVIEIDESIPFPTTAELENIGTGNTVVYKNIVVPGFDATDVNNGIKEAKITIKDPNGNILTATINADGNYEFTPVKEGVYTVEYKAVDKAGLTETLTRTIKVGDCEDPKIVVTGSENLPTTVKTDTQLVIDTSKITMSDNKDTNLTVKKNLTITLVGPDGKEIENVAEEDDEFIFDIKDAGSYKLIYKVTDTAGNYTTKTVLFEATVDSGNTIFTQETTGVIIIVVALAILAGAVIYFVKTKDKKEISK